MFKKSKLGRVLLTGASLTAMSAVAPAMAQDVSDEIVVTATGRAAAIQDVPIAVTAIGGEALQEAGVETIIDLRQITPNLRIGSGQSQSSGTSAAIRGIGTGSDNPGFEAAVGIFVDGVYRARTGTAIGDLPDVERIEILRGPQGTLYGKNTTAGAISIITAAPDFETGAWMEGTAGNYGLLGTAFGANLPVSDTLALRFDATGRARDGYITDVISDRDINTTNRWSARLQALWDITPNASLRVIVDAAETDEVCCGAVTLYDSSNIAAANGSFPFSLAMNVTQNNSILTPSLALPFTTPVAPPNPEARRMSVSSNRSYAEETDDLGASAQLDWDINGLNFTSITAYREWDSVRDQDIDFSAMDRSYRDDLEIGVESFTQEFRLQGQAGRVNWLVGLFYGDETINQTDRIQYGTQAATYLNSLIGFFDFAPLTQPDVLEPPDANGPIPGSGLGVFGCAPGTLATVGPGVGTSTCALDYALAALAGSADPVLSAGGVQTALNIAAGLGPGGFASDLSAAGLPAGIGQSGDMWSIETQSIAVFTHNEIALTDNLLLTLGLRWTQEEKDMTGDLNGTQPACQAIRDNADTAIAAALGYRANTLLPAPQQAALNGLSRNLAGAFLLACNPAVNNIQVLQNGGVYGASYDDDAFSGTISLSYDLSDDIMLYGGYSRGYKSGGFNIDRSGMAVLPFTELPADQSAYAQAVLGGAGLPLTFGASDLGFDPETIDAYEVGLKSTLLGGSTTINLAAFYQQLHDYQLNAFNGFNFITENVPEVVSQGVELEIAARPFDALTLTMGALYSDVYYDSTVAFGPNPSDVVRSGDPLTLTPEWTVTGSLLYVMPISNTLELSFYGNGRWVSDYRLQTLSRNPATDQESFALFDARVGLGAQDARWGIDFWVRNLTDEYYSVGAFAVPEQSLYNSTTGLTEGVFAAYPNEPRTYGVTLRARY